MEIPTATIKIDDKPISEITSSLGATDPVKPGWQTTEFWLGVAATVLTALYASGIIPTSGPAATIAGMAATVLIALGYKVSRAIVKAAAFVLLLGLGASSMTACADAKKAGVAVIDCTKTNYQVAAVQLAQCTTWSCVYQTAVGFGYTVGGCAFRALVDSGVQLASGDRSASGLPVPGVAAFERYRSEIANGSTYRTAQGDK